jgi:hypothetical protein
MAPNDFNKLLARKPFRAVTLHLSNGKKYEVRHPELAAVGLSVVLLSVPVNTAMAFLGHREVVVSLRHIVEIEVSGPPASQNGEGV